MIISKILLFFLLMDIYTGPIMGFLGDSFGLLDDLMVLLSLLFQVFLIVFLIGENKLELSKSTKKIIILYIILIFSNLFNTLFFKFELFYLPSFLYELYKFSMFFFFIPLTFLDSKIIFNITKGLINIMFFFLFINLIATIAQHIWSPAIIKNIGITGSSFVSSFELFQKTGLQPGKTISGILNLLTLVLTLIFNSNKHIFNNNSIYISKYKILLLQIISILGLTLSESKNVFFGFLVLFFIHLKIKSFYKYTFLISSFIGMLFYMYYSNIFDFQEKVDGYLYLINKFDTLLKNIELARGFVEMRGIELLKGLMTIYQNLPFGTGLGTWRDVPSNANQNARNILPYYSESSDSYISHIVVEQGIFSILYFYIFYLITKKHGKIGLSMFWIFFMFIGATMGPSSSVTPMIISFIFALFMSLDKVKEKTNQ